MILIPKSLVVSPTILGYFAFYPTFHFNRGNWCNISLIRMAVRGIGSAMVSPTISFSRAMSFITRTTSAILIPLGTTPTAAMISAGSSTSISKCMTTFDAPHAFNQPVKASLFSLTSSGVRCLMPYCFCLALISSRSQSRKPTKRIFDGSIFAGNSEIIVGRPFPYRQLQPWRDNPDRHHLAM